MTTITLKHCSKCGKDLPATTEYFYPSVLKPGSTHHICKTCHKQNSNTYFDPRREKLLEIAQPLQKYDRSSFYPLTAIAKDTGRALSKVESDVIDAGLRVYRYFYNSTGMSLLLSRLDSEAYIESNRLNGHHPVSKPTKTSVELGTPDRCGSCGTTKGNIVSDDVNEAIRKRRGWLCMKCYRLVRDSGGDVHRVGKVLAYLEQTH